MASLEDEPLFFLALDPVDRLRQRSRHLLGRPQHGWRVRQQAAQQIAPLFQRPRAQILAIEPQEVEREQDRLRAARVQELEARRAFRIERHDLAIDDRVADHELLQRRGQVRKALGEVDAIARPHGHLSVRDRRDRAIAVVLELEEPVAVRLGRGFDERCQHRWKHARQELLRLDPHDFVTLALPLGAARRRASAHDRLRLVGHDVAAGVRGLVLCLEEDPVALRAGRAARAYQMPTTAQFLAVKLDEQVALFAHGAGLSGRHRVVRAAVPNERVAAAIFAVRYSPFEAAVFERMIFGLHGEPLDVRVVARTFGHGPARQRVIHLEAQVVMQPRRVVLVNHEGGLRGRLDGPRRGLRGHRKVALGLVFRQSAAFGSVGCSALFGPGHYRRL
jgi:hypothetical protein